VRRTKGSGMVASSLAARRPSSRIRWDRVGRIALLCVLAFILYLYVGPARSWITAYGEAKDRRQQVSKLQARNAELRVQERRLRRPSALEREARRLGMVKAGERAYGVQGLPK
jgi:cell division protein FtsB